MELNKMLSFIWWLQNPKKKDPPQRNVGLDTKAEFGEKQKLFEGTPGGYAWISARVSYPIKTQSMGNLQR